MTNYRILHIVILLLLGPLLVTRSVALEIVGSVGGYCPSVAAKDGYVYLCEGRGLTVLDARAAGDPVVIERVRLDAGTTCVRLDNDVAYVGTVDKKVRIYSLANPASPSLLSTITLIGGSLTDAAFEGGHAFFANEGGVEIVDVSNPAAPVAVSVYGLSISGGEKRRLCLDGNRMFVSDLPVCKVVDISSPEQPRFLWNTPTPFSGSVDVSRVDSLSIVNGRLFIVWGLYHWPFFVFETQLWSVGTEGEPYLVEIVPLSDLFYSQVWTSNSKVYVLGSQWNIRSIGLTYDASSTDSLQLLRESRLPRPMLTATKIGSTIFAGNESGLTRIVINPDDTMTAEGSYYSMVSSPASAPCGGGYVVGGSEAIVLSGIDQPSEPDVRCAIKSSADFVSAAASGRFLYLSNQSEGLDVRYVTPEPTIANVATLDPLAWENLENPRYGGLALAGQRVWLSYTAGRRGAWTIGLIGFDDSNPLHPATLGSASRSSSYDQIILDLAGVAVSGTRACVAADKLYFFDIADPSSPRFLSEVAVKVSYESRVFWTDDMMLLMDDSHSLWVVNTSDAANPVLLAPSSPLTSHGSLNWLENGRAYIGNYGVLDIYRVVPGGDPVLLESYSSRSSVGSVEMYGGHVYAMDSLDGLLVMKTNFPDHLAQRHLLGSDTGAADQNGDGAIDAADLVLAMAAARE